jgi:L-methionine (R)-S-oxide reductase
MIKKESKYQRIYAQLEELLQKEGDVLTKQATIAAVLYHKIDYFFWCGFYILRNNDLLASAYQGPLACQKLEKGNGVCWSAIKQGKTLIVKNVEAFPDHIACDSRSKSEVVVPLRNSENDIIGVLDVDSDKLNSFDMIDAKYLEKIVQLISF